MYMRVLRTCMSMHPPCVPGAHRGHKTADPLGLALQIAIPCSFSSSKQAL